MDQVWRTLTKDDAAALAELNAAAEAVDRVDDHYNADDFVEEFEGPSLDARDGSRGVFIGERLVGAGIVYQRTTADPVHRMFFWGRVHPEFRRRGFGTRIVEWALEAGPRITERLFPGVACEICSPVHESLAGNAALLAAQGFEAERYEFSMELPLDERESGRTRVPDGFTLLNYEEALSEEFRETHNTAFVPDHPGSTVQTLESWPHVMSTRSPNFRADLSFGLRDAETGTLAGYLFSRFDEAAHEATGRRDLYIGYIGTRREYRRRGVAGALIDAAADGAAAAGFDTASLTVYADNPSGALGVYQSAGFEVRHKMTIVKRRVDA
ncbi:MAG TPA: GNAT family N-acetyltransferase [Actinospica sp.]|nr:GNAT family N-acetyltransferase [Actinospica sp.]